MRNEKKWKKKKKGIWWEEIQRGGREGARERKFDIHEAF